MNTISLLDEHDLDSLRQRGLVISAADGSEGLLISVQYLKPLPPDTSRSEWRACLESWCQEMAGTLGEHGARLYPETLSTSAQTVEAFVPVDRLEETLHSQKMNEVRLDLIVSHRVSL